MLESELVQTIWCRCVACCHQKLILATLALRTRAFPQEFVQMSIGGNLSVLSSLEFLALESVPPEAMTFKTCRMARLLRVVGSS
jgi:hypothetical protein